MNSYRYTSVLINWQIELIKINNVLQSFFQLTTGQQNLNPMIILQQSYLVLSIIFCKVRGPYTGMPWTNEELWCWTFELTSSSNSDAPSGVDTKETITKHLNTWMPYHCIVNSHHVITTTTSIALAILQVNLGVAGCTVNVLLHSFWKRSFEHNWTTILQILLANQKH